MKPKIRRILIVLLPLLLLGTVAVAVAADGARADPAATVALRALQEHDVPTNRTAPRTAVAYTTVITVNTTEDTTGDTQSKTCYYTYSTWFATDDGKCNLRRALVEASHRPPADRPILIRFDLPLTDTNYYSDTQTWEIVMDGDYWEGGLIYNNVTEPDGYVTIDGDTQPGGRSNGYPKVFINSENSLTVLSEHNTIRNLGFNGGGGIFLNSVTTGGGIGGHNTVESVWVGLRADGQEIVPGSNPDISLAGGGIDIKSSYNTISDTIVTGSNIGIRVQTQGDYNVIQSSYIGTRGDKTIPSVRLTCTASSVYNPAQWYGGWGIQFLGGSFNQVLSNTIAGVHSPHSPTETYPPAISPAGESNLFRYNTIGIDGIGAEVGTCGQGFDVSGHNIQILDNTIFGARSSYLDGDTGDPTEGAVYINDSSPLARKVTVRNNIVRDSTTKVIEFGPAIPEALRLFDPPRIVSIDGTLVVGETEVGSDCPNCLVELYLDDLDDGQDALELLDVAVIENVTGTARFTANLASPLPANHGIRVVATTQDDYVIGDYLSGTTTLMSPAYAPDATFVRDLAPGWNLFSIDVTPPDPAITEVLSSLAGQYDLVLGFDGGPAGGGKTYDPGNPGASDLTTIDVAHGYWIRITAATTQTLTLNYEPARDDTPIPLYEGWNLVSYLPDRTLVVTKALESISGDYDLVRSYDGGGKTYMPAQPQFSDLTEMEPGYAYWIKISEGAGAPILTYPLADTPVRMAAETTGPSAARAAPNIPQEVTSSDFFSPTTEWVDFYGVASLSGFSAPRNARVVAYDPDGVVAGAFTVHTPPYYGFLHVYVDDPNTPGDEGIQNGDEVLFTIDGRLAAPSKSTVWNSGVDDIEVNLEVIMPFVATDEWVDFWGTLTIGGEPAPVGTIVAAYDPGGVYIGDYILTEAGQYGFLHAYGDDTSTLADEGAVLGDNLSFKAFLPLGATPIVLTPDSGTPTWQGRGSRTEVNLSGSAPGPVAPSAVNISGPTVGAPNEYYTFTISVDPIDVTTPLTYVIRRTGSATPVTGQYGRTINYHNVAWSTLGTKVITVTASNEAGSMTSTHTITIVEGGVIAVTGVTITGPTAGNVDTAYTFTATVQPQNATGPIAYTWAPTPDSGQGTAYAAYTWDVASTQRITVTAANSGGSAQDTHDISISEAPVPGAPTAVTITGPTTGRTTGSYTFTITVDPIDVTLPLTYTLDYTDKESPPSAMSINDRVVTLPNRTWSTPGPKVITVTATNDNGSAVGTHSILIAKVFVAGPSGRTLIFTDTTGLRTIIDIPSGALSETTFFVYTPTVTIAHPAGSGFGFAGHSFDLDASPQISGQITITIEYRDQDWMDAGIAAESSLRLYYWNAGLDDWDDVANTCGTPAPIYAPDTDANVLAAPVCHLSEFAMLGISSEEQSKIYLPAVLKE
jgi:hypothetical protein